MTFSADRVLRRATVDDAHTLSRLGSETFAQTFGDSYRPKDLDQFLQQSYSPASFAKALGQSVYQIWIAEHRGVPIGYAQCGPCKLPHPEASPSHGELQRLYVLQEYHGCGVGTQLLNTALAELARAYPGPLWVGVWSENHGAQRLYARYGFEKVGEYGFPVGETIDREWILRRP